jgi:hypothetical protein
MRRTISSRSDTDATPILADPQTAKPEKVGNAKSTHPLHAFAAIAHVAFESKREAFKKR